MELLLSKKSDVIVLTALSKRAFESDIQVGGTTTGGPPGYKSEKFYAKMAGQKHLYTFIHAGLIVGGAVLMKKTEKLNIGRIFIDTNHFREGLGSKLMEEIESLYPDVTLFTLDTPIWNIRTNSFYQKLGYREYKRDHEFIYYAKKS